MKILKLIINQIKESYIYTFNNIKKLCIYIYRKFKYPAGYHDYLSPFKIKKNIYYYTNGHLDDATVFSIVAVAC
jgi:hypothetical protein